MSVFRVKFPPAANPNVQVNIPTRNTPTPLQKSVWAVGGGKGGVGKTLLASNMGVYLSWLNRRVVIVDMDLGGSNLHTALGVEPPTKTLADILTGRVENIQDLLQPTSIRNLSIISGAQDPMGITNLRPVQKSRLIRKLRDIDADNIILDLGAGTSSSTLDFFLMADRKILLVTPDPTSIENAYRFVKLAFYRMLRSGSTAPHVRTLIETAMDLKNNRGIRTPKDLLSEVARISPSDGQALQSLMQSFQMDLVVNQIRVRAEADIGKSIQLVCQKYFGMRVDYVGFLPYDNSVWQSVRKRKPFLLEAPNSTAVTHLEDILRNLLRAQGQVKSA